MLLLRFCKFSSPGWEWIVYHPSMSKTSFIPDNTRKTIRSQEQGLFSVAPRLRGSFTLWLFSWNMFALYDNAYFMYLPFCFYTSARSGTLITELTSLVQRLSASVTQAYLFWLLLIHLKRCSGVSWNPSLSHLRHRRLILGQPVAYCELLKGCISVLAASAVLLSARSLIIVGLCASAVTTWSAAAFWGLNSHSCYTSCCLSLRCHYCQLLMLYLCNVTFIF